MCNASTHPALLQTELGIKNTNVRRTLVQAVCREIEGLGCLGPPSSEARNLAHDMCCSVLQWAAVCCSVLQCVAVCCCASQCVAVCCNVLQCVAVRCSALQFLLQNRGPWMPSFLCVYLSINTRQPYLSINTRQPYLSINTRQPYKARLCSACLYEIQLLCL